MSRGKILPEISQVIIRQTIGCTTTTEANVFVHETSPSFCQRAAARVYKNGKIHTDNNGVLYEVS